MDFKERVKDFVNIYKVSLIIGIILLVLILGGSFSIYYLLINKINQMNSDTLSTSIYYEEDKEEAIEEQSEIFYKVDIKGAVNNPGVYELLSTSRIVDVIDLAGGLTEDANTSVTNLSKYITDEMVIVIYNNDEVLNFKTVLEEEEQEEQQCIIYNEIIQNDSCINNDKEKEEQGEPNNSTDNIEIDAKISINTADINLLMSLPGVGESKAKSIIEYRETKGLFTKIEDIMNVSGIGEKLFEDIKDYITI